MPAHFSVKTTAITKAFLGQTTTKDWNNLFVCLWHPPPPQNKQTNKKGDGGCGGGGKKAKKPHEVKRVKIMRHVKCEYSSDEERQQIPYPFQGFSSFLHNWKANPDSMGPGSVWYLLPYSSGTSSPGATNLPPSASSLFSTSSQTSSQWQTDVSMTITFFW